MIIKYGTTESVEVIDAKNIPSWVGGQRPQASTDQKADDNKHSVEDGKEEQE